MPKTNKPKDEPAGTNGTVEKGSLPPYIAWKAFLNFIVHLQKTVIPPRIDSSMMPTGMSGGTRSQLRVALKFLGLIDDADRVSNNFRDLIAAYGKSEWGNTLGDVISSAYSRVTDGLDLDAGTARQLADHFRAAGHVDGEVLERCVRFYLQAIKSAGMTYSPHFDARGTKTAMRGKRAAKAKPGADATEIDDDNNNDDDKPNKDQSQAKVRKFTLAIPGKPDAVITVPHDLTEKEWKMIDATLRAFVSLNAPDQE